MRSLQRTIQSNNLFVKIVIFSTVLITLSIGIVSSIMYNRFALAATSQAFESAQKMLLQTSRSSNFLYDLTTSFGNTLLNDNEIINAIYSDTLSPQDMLMIDGKLTKMMASNPAVHSVYLYNKKLDKYVSTTLNVEQNDREFIQHKERYLQQRYHFIPRTLSYSINGKNVSSKVLTYIFSDLPSYARGTDSSVIVNISVSYLQSLINSMNASDGSSVVIIDRNGNVISELDHFGPVSDLSGISFIQNIVASKQDSGDFITEIGHQKTLVTYVSSPMPNWTFVSFTSYSYLTKGMRDLKTIVWTICSIVLLVAIVASLFIARKIYSPFDKQMMALKQSSKESQPILKENFLRQLLNEIPTDNRNLDHKFKFLSVALDPRSFVILLFKIDRFEAFKTKYDERERTLLHFAICNIASEIASERAKNECFMWDENIAVLMLNTEGASGTLSADNVILLSERIQSSIAKYLKFSVTVAIGERVEEVSQLGRSFQSALEWLNYRFLWGWETVLYQEKIAARLNAGFAYPAAQEKKIMEAVKSNDQNRMKQALGELVESTKTMTYDHAVFTITQLSIHSAGLAKSLNLGEGHSELGTGLIRDAEWIWEVEQRLLDYYLAISQKLTDKRHNKNIVLIEKILDYLEGNYGDPNLSSDFMADMLGISPQYFSKLFKEVTGQNYSEYVSDLRLGKSKELLGQSTYSIDEIARKTGFSSQSYFALRFKKKFGVTPNEFRSNKKSLPYRKEHQ
ncbi:helix-turn-helix domain-containing protein [Paenibacillaceae bacterium WGS1546]|uniref:helix-turn-helix domain-containing protein n=1 Tax=Cohnella sp. WGS1546 TaxID=3366810 RepID=UPI00372D7516